MTVPIINETSLGTFRGMDAMVVHGDFLFGYDYKKLYAYNISSGSAVAAGTVTFARDGGATGIEYVNGDILVSTGIPSGSHFTMAAYHYNEGLGTFSLVTEIDVSSAYNSYARVIRSGPTGVVLVAANTGGVYAFSYDGATFTQLGNYRITGSAATDVTWDGTYVYASDHAKGLLALSYTAGTLDLIRQIYVPRYGYSGDMVAATVDDAQSALCITNGGGNIYVGTISTEGVEDADYRGLVYAFSFSGTAFSYVSRWEAEFSTEMAGLTNVLSLAYSNGVVYASMFAQFSAIYLDSTLKTAKSYTSVNFASDFAPESGIAINEYGALYFILYYSSVSHLYSWLEQPVLPIRSQPTSTIFVAINSAKALSLGSKVIDDAGTGMLQVTNYKGRTDYQDVLLNGGA